MEELFRLNIVRPPNTPSEKFISLDYGDVQNPYPGDSLLSHIHHALDAEKNKAGLTTKQVARMAVVEVESRLFRTQASVDASFYNADLEAFLVVARETAGVVAKEMSDGTREDGTLTEEDLKALKGSAPFAALEAVTREVLSPHFIKLIDSFLAQFIWPRPDGPSLGILADLIRSGRLTTQLMDSANNAFAPKTLGDLEGALDGVLQLPQMLQSSSNRVQPIGVADLFVVKQQLLRYEAADIQRIENVLKGETRGHTVKQSQTIEHESLYESERIAETSRSISTTDRSSLKFEIQNSLKEVVDTKANLDLGYGAAAAGTWHFKVSAGVQYTRSSEEASKFASEIAKDVTQSASSKLTERVKSVERTKTVETIEDLEDLSFDNKEGDAHVSGIYQYVNKVYLAQVFNYGKRLLFDLNIPEPGAYLIDLGRQAAAGLALQPPPPLRWAAFDDPAENRPALSAEEEGTLAAGPKKVTFFNLRPDHLRADSGSADEQKLGVPYSHWVAQYGVQGVEASPEFNLSAPWGKAREIQANATSVVIEDQVQLPDGYRAYGAHVTAGWRHHTNALECALLTVRIADGPPVLSYDLNTIAQGPGAVLADHITNEPDIRQDNFSLARQYVEFVPQVTEPVTGSVPISVSASNIDHVTVTAQIHCQRMDSRLRKWQLETYARIVERHAKLQDEYDRAKAAFDLASARIGPIGRNPSINRMTERRELQRGAITILANQGGQAIMGKDGTNPFNDAKDSQGGPLSVAPLIQEPDLAASPAIGRLVRFFEQAFEWEKIGYVLYPYFWGRMDKWSERLGLTNEDPQFEEFLQAGYARVMVPVRPGFETAVLYYLLWDEPWEGGDMPVVGDPLYLPIAEEIRQRSGAPGDETPEGTPWEIVVPTNLVKLRKEDALPAWTWKGHEGEIAAMQNGQWSWQEVPAPDANG